MVDQVGDVASLKDLARRSEGGLRLTSLVEEGYLRVEFVKLERVIVYERDYLPREISEHFQMVLGSLIVIDDMHKAVKEVLLKELRGDHTIINQSL